MQNHSITRTLIINIIIDAKKYKSYLEIGVQNPVRNFDLIDCKDKVGVDPYPLRGDILAMTSNEYFSHLDNEAKFDLIFIDGLHHADQVLTDINNALLHLNEGGTIVCHDMLPENERMQLIPMTSQQAYAWTGDCWKAWAHLRMTDSGLSMNVIDSDYGVGIIQRGEQVLFKPQIDFEELNYSFFNLNRRKLMNVIEVKDLIQQLNNFDKVS